MSKYVKRLLSNCKSCTTKRFLAQTSLVYPSFFFFFFLLNYLRGNPPVFQTKYKVDFFIYKYNNVNQHESHRQ